MEDPKRLLEILERVNKASILVVGDVMLDRYWWGSASRLSPEAPVPVVALKKVTHIPGGAANVGANIASLGATVFLAGMIGQDEAGRSLSEAIGGSGISTQYLVTSADRPTTTKTRVLVHNHQIARVDDETDRPVADDEQEQLLSNVRRVIAEADAVVLSDYSKGCLSRTFSAEVIDLARQNNKMILVDPKCRDLTVYSGATLLTPNLAEAMAAAGIENGGEERADEAAEKILTATSVESLLITLGEHGMKLFRKDATPEHFPSMARQVFDVTGAGDTVVALLAAALGAKASLAEAICLANIGAGLAVEKVGTSVVEIDEFRAAITNGLANLSPAS